MTTLNDTQLGRLALELHRRYRRVPHGLHGGALSGFGLAPLPARPYEPGDPANRIAWPETMQFGELMTKEFVVDNDARALLVIDYSDGMDWAGDEALELKRELAGYCAEALTQLLIWQKDTVSHLVAGATVSQARSHRGQEALFALRSLLRKAVPAESSSLAAALRTALRTHRQRELVIVISDFLGEGWELPLKALARQHDVIAVQIVDPWDLELPAIGTLVVADGDRTRRLNTNRTKVRETYRQEAAAHQRHVTLTMRSANIRHTVLDNSRPLLRQLIHAFGRDNQRRSA